MMHMTFYWSRQVTLLFDSWKTDMWTSYSLTLLACLLVPAFYQYLGVRLVRGRDGTERDGTERDGTGRNEGVIFEKDMGYICLKMVKHCVPQTWNKPVPGGRGGTQKHPKSVPWNNPFHPFLAHQTRDGTPRSVPSRPVPRTKRTLEDLRVRIKRATSSSSLKSSSDAPIRAPLLNAKIGGTGGRFSAGRLAESVLFEVNAAIGYMIMLAIMSFNGGVFVAIVVGLAIGYLAFRSADDDVAGVVVDNSCACA
ncbi:unnamed protein product [Malus baccata var. baccata]